LMTLCQVHMFHRVKLENHYWRKTGKLVEPTFHVLLYLHVPPLVKKEAKMN
jgi:hypothetical protein